MRPLAAWGVVTPVLAVALAAAGVSAHHSFSAVYDGSREIDVEGVVTDFRFVNPHAMMSIDVTDETGKVVRWVVELAGRLNLADVGWTADSVKAGERVRVSGNPTHTGSQRMFFRRLVRADGMELLTANEQRADAVEEDRRRRARQRDQKK